MVTSSSNLLNDSQYQVLPLQNPGLELTMLSGDPLHCVFPVTPPEGEKTLVVRSQETPNLVQFKSVFIQEKDLPVGGRLRQFLPEWEKHGSHQLIVGLIRDGYKLPFREHPNLSRVPCIISSYAGFDKQNALWASIQHLLQKGAVEVVHTPESLGFYSHLFLVPKPGNHWRPVIDLSSLKKFLAIPKFKMETPECLPQERGMGHIYRSHRRLLTRANSHPVSKIPGFISKASLTSSPASPSS